ncbi:MAG TPA: hypothetical protein VGD77_10980 [Gemmatimonadaceae bacterium]
MWSALVGGAVRTAPLSAQAPHDAARPVPPPSTPAAGPPQSVTGRVIRAGGGAEDPVPSAWVVLHRLGNDGAGPLDSVRTGTDGGYRFRYHRTGDPDALYFASTTYGGIAYFASPFRAAAVSGDDATITVFDTTSVPVPMRVEGRHFVVSQAHDGTREVLEVYELANDATYTVVAKGTRPVWSAAVPDGATQFVPGDGESARGAIELREGRAELFAPVAPGLKQVSFRYQLPVGRFPVTVDLPAATSVLEVLVEEPRARVGGAKLREVETGQAEGRTFRRFLAQDVAKGDRFTVDPGRPPVRRAWMIGGALALVALALGGALRHAMRRAPVPAPTPMAVDAGSPPR